MYRQTFLTYEKHETRCARRSLRIKSERYRYLRDEAEFLNNGAVFSQRIPVNTINSSYNAANFSAIKTTQNMIVVCLEPDARFF